MVLQRLLRKVSFLTFSCFKIHYFPYDGAIYEQQDSAASTVIATGNLYGRL